MDKDNNNDTSYFNSPDNNNSAGDNHIVYKNKFQPNSRYFTIVIYGLLFVLGAILIFQDDAIRLAVEYHYIIPTCKIFLQTFVQGKMPFEVGQAF